jgi:hypothetical protein
MADDQNMEINLKADEYEDVEPAHPSTLDHYGDPDDDIMEVRQDELYDVNNR